MGQLQRKLPAIVVSSGVDNGLWVAVGDGSKIATSPDGNIWTAASNVDGISYGYGIAYGQDGTGAALWVVNGGKTMSSSTGTSWTAASSRGALRRVGVSPMAKTIWARDCGFPSEVQQRSQQAPMELRGHLLIRQGVLRIM
jgi:hypothetical protein